jgi:prophage antirepressor-like protein
LIYAFFYICSDLVVNLFGLFTVINKLNKRNMNKQTAIKLFETKKIRTSWNEDEEEWYFSVVDVVGVLTDSPDAKRYWSVLKTRLKQEGVEGTTICSTLKLPAQDGKMRMTDVASTEQIFRIIQSIPSPKAEPFKQWLAHVAKERLDQ